MFKAGDTVYFKKDCEATPLKVFSKSYDGFILVGESLYTATWRKAEKFSYDKNCYKKFQRRGLIAIAALLAIVPLCILAPTDNIVICMIVGTYSIASLLNGFIYLIDSMFIFD